jgi:hypothetical protein
VNGITRRNIAWFLVAFAGLAVVIGAFLRGEHLLGLSCGFAYSAVAMAFLWFLVRCQSDDGRISFVRAGVVLLVALPVASALAFPAAVNPDVQVFIDKQALDRLARKELAAVFASDAAFDSLSVSSEHLKAVNITVLGELKSDADLKRVRSRVEAECPTVSKTQLHWGIVLKEPGNDSGR